MDPLDEQMLQAALAAARDAAEIHRREAGRLRESDWEEKGASDFVTRVDVEAERTIVGRLRERFPGHQVVAEESADEAARGGKDGAPAPDARDAGAGAGRGTPSGDAPGAGPGGVMRWLVDPLDGTTNWLHGYPEYSVSIAAADARGLRVGVVLNSATGETFHAVRGAGSHRDGEPIHASEVSDLRRALIGTGFPFKNPELLPRYLRMLDAVLRSTSGVRRGGSAALDLCDLACGRLDAFWELWLMPWDVAAGGLIIREAGGVFGPLAEAAGGLAEAAGDVAEADGRGSWLGPPRAGAYIAANGRLRDPLARLLAESADGAPP